MNLSKLSELPGCYLFKAKKGEVLYVGKAINIKKRVTQYFRNTRGIEKRIRQMVADASRVDTIVVGSEIEALILEANLIKKYKPKYNSLLKDDKSFTWIVITNEPFPRVITTRKVKLFPNARIFGPYPLGAALSETLRFLCSVFPYRRCKHPISADLNVKDLKEIKRCFYYHLGDCVVEADGTIDQKRYMKNIHSIVLFLQSRKPSLINRLKREMKILSETNDYEQAAKVRDQIDALETISKRVYIQWGQDEYDIRSTQRQRARNGLQALIEILIHQKITSKKPTEYYIDNHRIECYDISNISGELATGSMVVFEAGQKKTSDYRRFRIRLINKPNDYKMMQEVFSRRFARSGKEITQAKEFKDPSFSKLPKLIIVDGGKGQRNAAEKALAKNPGVPSIPIIGLSKRNEELWVKDEKYPIVLPKASDALFLVERIRDEAHRFAINYHRKLRSSELRGG